MAVLYNPKTTSDGLLFAVDAANTRSYPGSGTTFFDISKNGVNSLGYASNISASNFTGEYVDLNGTDEEIGFRNITTTTNSFTAECWANWDDVGLNSGSVRVPFGFGAFFRLYLNGSGYLNFWVRETGQGASSAVTDNISVTQANKWYHLVGTCQGGGSRKLYRNGELRNSDTISFNVDTGNGTNNLFIGNAYVGAPNYFDGKVAMARIYDRVLTDEEVFGNYNALKGRFGL